MPPNFQRLLPFVLIAVVLLFVLPTLFRKHSSGPSAGTRATGTIDAMNLIDKGEQGYKTAHGRFTPHLADLLPLNTRLANDRDWLCSAFDPTLSNLAKTPSALPQQATPERGLSRAEGRHRAEVAVGATPMSVTPAGCQRERRQANDVAV